MTKCEMDIPMSSQDPVFRTLKNMTKLMAWQRRRRIPKFLSTSLELGRSARQKEETRRKGARIFTSIRSIMTQGENTLTKHLVLEGSKELTLPMLPVPKKERNTKNNCNTKKVTLVSESFQTL